MFILLMNLTDGTHEEDTSVSATKVRGKMNLSRVRFKHVLTIKIPFTIMKLSTNKLYSHHHYVHEITITI